MWGRNVESLTNPYFPEYYPPRLRTHEPVAANNGKYECKYQLCPCGKWCAKTGANKSGVKLLSPRPANNWDILIEDPAGRSEWNQAISITCRTGNDYHICVMLRYLFKKPHNNVCYGEWSVTTVTEVSKSELQLKPSSNFLNSSLPKTKKIGVEVLVFDQGELIARGISKLQMKAPLRLSPRFESEPKPEPEVSDPQEERLVWKMLNEHIVTPLSTLDATSGNAVVCLELSRHFNKIATERELKRHFNACDRVTVFESWRW